MVSLLFVVSSCCVQAFNIAKVITNNRGYIENCLRVASRNCSMFLSLSLRFIKYESYNISMVLEAV